MKTNWSGVYTALITPFQQGRIDFDSFAKLLHQQEHEQKVSGFVINGTTAESPTLSKEEVHELFTFARNHTKLPLIVGSGSNSTAATVLATKRAEEWGADACLVVVPYYNKPPQRGLLKHFTTVAESTRLPVILYNVPGRTITSLEPATVAELSQVKNIVGIKEATGNIELLKKMKSAARADFQFLSGDDGTYAEFLGHGGVGVISVTSHFMGRQMQDWTDWSRLGKNASAVSDSARYKKLIDLTFCEANPIPVKKAMQMLGVIESAECRLPLVEMDPELAQVYRQELIHTGILAAGSPT